MPEVELRSKDRFVDLLVDRLGLLVCLVVGDLAEAGLPVTGGVDIQVQTPAQLSSGWLGWMPTPQRFTTPMVHLAVLVGAAETAAMASLEGRAVPGKSDDFSAEGEEGHEDGVQTMPYPGAPR